MTAHVVADSILPENKRVRVSFVITLDNKYGSTLNFEAEMSPGEVLKIQYPGKSITAIVSSAGEAKDTSQQWSLFDDG